MHLAGPGQDQLLDLAVVPESKGGILLVKPGETGTDLLLVVLALRQDGHVRHGLGEVHPFQAEGLLPRTQGIAGVGVLQLHGGPDLAGADDVQFIAGVAVGVVDLAEPFRRVFRRVVHVAAVLDFSGKNPEIGEFPDVGLGDRLEHQRGQRAGRIRVQRDFLAAARWGCRHRRAVRRRSHVRGRRVHHAGDADVCRGARRQHGEDGAVLHPLAQPFEELLFGQRTFFEVNLEQFVVGFRHGFYQFFPMFLRLVGEVSGDLGALALAVAALESHRLHGDQVDDARESIGFSDRNLDGNGLRAEAFLQAAQRVVEVGVFLVQEIDHHHAGQAVLVRVLPGALRLHLDAFYGLDHDGHVVRDAHGAVHFAGEIGIARGVENMEVVVVPFAVQRRQVHGNAVFDLFLAVVRHGVAVVHATEPVRGAGVEEHGFRQGGLAAPPVAREANVSDFFDVIFLHEHPSSSGLRIPSITLYLSKIVSTTV